MSKDLLMSKCNSTVTSTYSWALYFFTIDKRARQPYKAYKVRFKNDDYLTQYASTMMSTVEKYQINPIEKVQDYDGENTKISCDKIAVSNPLITEQWSKFVSSLAVASDSKVDGKVNGYILVGQPLSDEATPISFIKFANPIIKLANKKSVVFSATVENELELISDDVYRLYLTVDAIVLNDEMYTFNHSFETPFGLEKTMAKLKQFAIEEIIATGAFADINEFKALSNQYRSARTFISLNTERVNRIKDPQNRAQIAIMLGLTVDGNGSFVVKTAEEASLLLRYLCFKIFQDNETKAVLEASTVTKIAI